MAVALVCAGVLAMSSAVFADGCGKGGSKGCELLMKIKMMIMHKAELGLTDEQVDKLADVKHAVMKDVIRMDAESDVLDVDIKALLWKDTVDVEALKPLVEKKYGIEKDIKLRCIQALADAKKVLSAEQNKKLKDLCVEKMKQGCRGGMCGAGRGPGGGKK